MIRMYLEHERYHVLGRVALVTVCSYYGLGMVALGLDLPVASHCFQMLMMHLVFS